MRISRITAEPIVGRLRPETAIASSLAKHIVGQYVLVRIQDDQGRTGLGEASVTSVWSGETQAGAIHLIEKVIANLLKDADPFDIEWITLKLHRHIHANSFARAAVEMALLDLQGQSLGVPLYKLLGGTAHQSDSIRLKFVIGAEEPDIAARRAAELAGNGWNAFKVKVGRQGDPRIDLERIKAVRTAIGPDTWLSVDANGAFTVADAIWLSKKMDPLEIVLFEQPTPRGDHSSMKEVRDRSPIPVMADESVFTALDALEIIKQDSADILSLYPGKHAGIRATQQIAKMAEAAGIPCTIGSNLEREVATAAMAHVAMSTANIQCEKFPGDLIGPLYFGEALSDSPLNYSGDRLKVPTAHGLGVTVSWNASMGSLPVSETA